MESGKPQSPKASRDRQVFFWVIVRKIGDHSLVSFFVADTCE